MQPRGFRVARPVPATGGGWLCDGWSACEWIDGLRPAAPDWPTVIAAGLDFGDAAEAVRDDGVVLRGRTHRWAVADRVAWGEERVTLSTGARVIHGSLATLLGEPSGEAHFVHGDLSGNVFLDPDGVPVILDVSPYLRPRSWAAAIVIADAVLWNGMAVQEAAQLAADAGRRELFVRALIFRLVAEQLAEDPRRDALLAPYRRVLAALACAGYAEPD